MTDGEVRPESTRDGSVVWAVVLSAAGFAIALGAAVGLSGLLYAVIYAAAIAPGVLLGRRVAGSHPVGWIVGAAFGYGLTQLALWVPIAVHRPGRLAFIAIWVAELLVCRAIARRIKAPLLVLPRATASDVRALALTLLLVPVLFGPPYRNLGIADASGTRYYRAYFTADFVWHTALTAELGRYDSPPRNPYMAAEKMHYYWGYFLLPAVVAHEAPAPLGDVQRALKANAMLSAALLVGLLFWLVRTAVPSGWVAGAAVALGVLAQSAEGSYVLQQFWRTGQPLAGVTDLNIDAISDWWFHGLRIDGLVRALWYNPQHSFACALGLVAALIAATRSHIVSRDAGWLAGAALGLSMCFNPFVGAVFSLIYGLVVTFDAVRQPHPLRNLVWLVKAALPVALGLLWCLYNGVAEGADSTVLLGFYGKAAENTMTVLLVSLGPVLLPAVAGFWPWRGLPAQPAIVASVGVLASLLLMHLVRLADVYWVGFRTGQILLLMLPILLARVLWVLGTRRAWLATALGGLILIAGLPTTIIDAYNAQDLGNRGENAGFHWVLTISPAQQAAFAWIHAHVAEDAVVQMEPMIRGREHWSLIPSFAERRMAAGLAIPLVGLARFEAAAAQVQRIYTSADQHEAWQLAHSWGINYLYVDATDRAAYPEGVRKFDADPALFRKVFGQRDVALYEVR